MTWFCQTAWRRWILSCSALTIQACSLPPCPIQLRRRWYDVLDENVCRFNEDVGSESYFRAQFQSYVESLGRSPKRCSILRTSVRGIPASMAMSSAAS